jgi:TetR/AcrR family transcriptional repressor of nem operon
MRRSKTDTVETRARIVETAAAEFRRKGIAETGLSELMAAAGLTHGGFYRHFDSKNQLAVEACQGALASMTEGMANSGSLETLLDKYLSPSHRDCPDNGCPLAALGSELGRAGEEMRKTAANGYQRLVNVIAGQITGLSTQETQMRAMAIASAMIGAMTVSRIVTDPLTSNAVLAGMRDYILEAMR